MDFRFTYISYKGYGKVKRLKKYYWNQRGLKYYLIINVEGKEKEREGVCNLLIVMIKMMSDTLDVLSDGVHVWLGKRHGSEMLELISVCDH